MEKGFFESMESKVRREWREKCPKAMGKPRGSGCDPNEGTNVKSLLLSRNVSQQKTVFLPLRHQEKQLELVNTSG